MENGGGINGKVEYSLQKKVIFGSVVYNDALIYLSEFIDSLNRQTTDDFVILLLNDGVPIEKLKKEILPIRDHCRIVQYEKKYSPPQLRVKLIQEAKGQGADILVFGDADDLFSNNRIENVIKAFRANPFADFAYNDLLFFNRRKVIRQMPEQLYDIKEIAEKNFLGMSNTAIRVSVLDDEFIHSFFECNTHVFDWYLYSRLLLAGYKGIKVKKAYTLYRIYDGNYVGFPAVTEEAVNKEIEIKKQHYELLKKRDSRFEMLYNCFINERIQRGDLKLESADGHYWWDFTRGVKI